MTKHGRHYSDVIYLECRVSGEAAQRGELQDDGACAGGAGVRLSACPSVRTLDPVTQVDLRGQQ